MICSSWLPKNQRAEFVSLLGDEFTQDGTGYEMFLLFISGLRWPFTYTIDAVRVGMYSAKG